MKEDSPELSGKMPLLLVICGPFACGKNALIKRLLASGRYKKCISATTRKPRPGEVDGADYLFMSRVEFRRRKKAGEFLETAENHGHLYGTFRSSVLEALAAGEWVIIDIDIKGIESLHRLNNGLISQALVTIYLEVELTEAIERARKRDPNVKDSDLIQRIITRESEEAKKDICNYRIPNPDGAFDETLRKINHIITRREVEYYCDR